MKIKRLIITYCVVFCVICVYLIIHFLNKHKNTQNKNIYHLSFLFFILSKDKNLFYQNLFFLEFY